MKTSLPRSSRAGAQRGVVLIVALVMLVVISVASVTLMRNVLSADLVAENSRRQTQAMLAAQAALRYCETEVQRASAIVQEAAETLDQESWKDFDKWMSTGEGRVDVPAEFMASDHSADGAQARPDNAPTPQCMAQRRLVNGETLTVVTARGFSDDYRADAEGRTQSGSVVWLQSIIQLGTVSAAAAPSPI